jgi:hypothetical protein
MPGVVEPVAVFPQGRWACLEMEVSGPAQDAGVPDGGSLGTFSVWLDGSEVLTKQSVTLYPIQRVAFDYIYSFAVQTGNEVWLDDLIVDNSPIGCEN